MIDSLLAADRWLFIVLNSSLHWAPIDALMMMLSEVKHFYLLVGLFLALLIWKGGPSGRKTALLLVLALIASDQIASFVIKPIFLRVRPCRAIADAIVLGGCGGGVSFPSNHAMNSFAFMAVLAHFYPRNRKYYYLFAGLIAYSRIHVGAHYPLDVLCGAAFGYGLGNILVSLWRLIERHANKFLVAVADWYHAIRRLMEWLRKRVYALPMLSGFFLGIAFPGTHYGLSASFGLLPLLFAIEKMERRHWWNYFKIFYVFYFVFHLIANYWIGGWSAEADPFLMIACVVLMFVHPLMLMPPMIAYAWIRRRMGLRAALAALPFVWTAWEYLHSIGDVGYPWLTLGNTQTYYTEGIQFISFTGVYGISFLLLAQNVLLFYLISRWTDLKNIFVAPRMTLPVVMLICSVMLPALQSEFVFRENDVHPAPEKKFRVAIVQPNIDPWVKWKSSDDDNQIAQMESQSYASLPKHPDMLLWPETAIPFYITAPVNSAELVALHKFVDSCAVPLLTGIPDMVVYKNTDPHPQDAQPLGNGMSVAEFNSSALVAPHSLAMQIYHKHQLVPFGERTPFVDEVPMFGDVIRWGVGLSGWSKGTDNTIFVAAHNGDTARVYGMICYESVYPSLVREFVNGGANMLTIITNDGWYGRTSGPVQHQQFAVLRAIENRRAVARCANTGISCFVDKFGNVDQRTKLYEQATIVGDCKLNNEITFYTAHGDLLAWMCCGVTVLVVLAAIVKRKNNFEQM